MQEFDPVEFQGVEALSDTDSALLCRIDGRPLPIPPRFTIEGSEVRKPGDRGRLIIPRWLAKKLGLGSA